MKDAAKAGDSKSSTADKAKIQNQQTEIRKLNQKGMLLILESRKVPIYRVHTMVWYNWCTNHILKHSKERRQHAEIEQLKIDLHELNEDYTAMSAEVQKNDQGNYP